MLVGPSSLKRRFHSKMPWLRIGGRWKEKRMESVRAVFCGTGATRLRSRPSVRLPTMLPSDDELVANLVDGMPPLANFESR